jgi:hypothetical protein
MEVRIAYRVSERKPERKRLRNPSCRWKDNIEVGF